MTTMTDMVDTEANATPGANALQFVEPLPGFGDELSYTLSPIDDHGLLFSMRSVTSPDVRFVLAVSDGLFDDYVPPLGDDVEAALGLVEGDEVTTLVMLSIPSGLHDAFANMRAPVVIANETGRALQVILDDETLPMRRPLIG